jgi:hypothetical protein
MKLKGIKYRMVKRGANWVSHKGIKGAKYSDGPPTAISHFWLIKEIVFWPTALEKQSSKIFLVFKTKYKTDFKKCMTQANSSFEVSSEEINLTTAMNFQQFIIFHCSILSFHPDKNTLPLSYPLKFLLCYFINTCLSVAMGTATCIYHLILKVLLKIERFYNSIFLGITMFTISHLISALQDRYLLDV